MSYKNLALKINNLESAFIATKSINYLTFFRISVGIIALVDILSLRSDLLLFFSRDSTIIPQELSYLFTEYFNYLNPFYSFLTRNGILDLFYQYVLLAYVLFLVCMIFGFLTRFSTFFALILQLIIFKSFAVFNYGYDHFLTMSLFYCLIFPVGKVNSIDNKLFKNNKLFKYSFDYQKVLQIHLGIIYFFAGLAKMVSVTWWNGEAIWRSIASIYDDLFKISPVVLAMAGSMTVLAELGYPFLVLFPKTRRIAVFTMILMHIFIATILDLPMFAAIMIVWNITSYYKYFFANDKE